MEENNKLIKGIIKQSNLEAAEIIQKAEKNISDKNIALESSKTRIINETDKKISKKLEELDKRADSAVKTEIRRQNLLNREKIYSEINNLVHKKIEKLISTEEYTDFITKLIAEGAIAVNDDIVFVKTSFRETLNLDILSSAEKLVENRTGKNISIKLSEKQPLTGQGIIVESSNGRIAYNNQIESRLRRFSEEIKMIIINGLAKE